MQQRKSDDHALTRNPATRRSCKAHRATGLPGPRGLASVRTHEIVRCFEISWGVRRGRSCGSVRRWVGLARSPLCDLRCNIMQHVRAFFVSAAGGAGISKSGGRAGKSAWLLLRLWLRGDEAVLSVSGKERSPFAGDSAYNWSILDGPGAGTRRSFVLDTGGWAVVSIASGLWRRSHHGLWRPFESPSCFMARSGRSWPKDLLPVPMPRVPHPYSRGCGSPPAGAFGRPHGGRPFVP